MKYILRFPLVNIDVSERDGTAAENNPTFPIALEKRKKLINIKIVKRQLLIIATT